MSTENKLTSIISNHITKNKVHYIRNDYKKFKFFFTVNNSEIKGFEYDIYYDYCSELTILINKYD